MEGDCHYGELNWEGHKATVLLKEVAAMVVVVEHEVLEEERGTT